MSKIAITYKGRNIKVTYTPDLCSWACEIAEKGKKIGSAIKITNPMSDSEHFHIGLLIMKQIADSIDALVPSGPMGK